MLDGTKKTCTSFGKAKGGIYRCKKYRKGAGMPPTPAGVCRHPTGPIQRRSGRCAAPVKATKRARKARKSRSARASK